MGSITNPWPTLQAVLAAALELAGEHGPAIQNPGAPVPNWRVLRRLDLAAQRGVARYGSAARLCAAWEESVSGLVAGGSTPVDTKAPRFAGAAELNRFLNAVYEGELRLPAPTPATHLEVTF
jgi:hypothetical protein